MQTCVFKLMLNIVLQSDSLVHISRQHEGSLQDASLITSWTVLVKTREAHCLAKTKQNQTQHNLENAALQNSQKLKCRYLSVPGQYLRCLQL